MVTKKSSKRSNLNPKRYQDLELSRDKLFSTINRKAPDLNEPFIISKPNKSKPKLKKIISIFILLLVVIITATVVSKILINVYSGVKQKETITAYSIQIINSIGSDKASKVYVLFNPSIKKLLSLATLKLNISKIAPYFNGQLALLGLKEITQKNNIFYISEYRVRAFNGSNYIKLSFEKIIIVGIF